MAIYLTPCRPLECWCCDHHTGFICLCAHDPRILAPRASLSSLDGDAGNHRLAPRASISLGNRHDRRPDGGVFHIFKNRPWLSFSRQCHNCHTHRRITSGRRVPLPHPCRPFLRSGNAAIGATLSHDA